MPAQHDELSKQARDELLKRIAKSAEKSSEGAVQGMAEAYARIMEAEPHKPGKAAGM